MKEDQLELLLDALNGVGITECEMKVLKWLAGWEPETVKCLARLIRKARGGT